MNDMEIKKEIESTEAMLKYNKGQRGKAYESNYLKGYLAALKRVRR